MNRATIRKRDGRWVLTWQPYGFGKPVKYYFDSHPEATQTVHQRRRHSVAAAMLASCDVISGSTVSEITIRRT